MSLLPEKQFSRLREAVDWSSKQLEFQRRKRLEAVKEFTGFHYAEGGNAKRNPVNMLALATQIYVRQLAARSPRVLITTKRSDLRPTATNMELAINQIPDEIGLDSTFRRFVLEAMFAVGVVKVGLHAVGSALGHAYGESFVDVITLDDYFCDMTAKRFDLIDFEGNDYWLNYDEVMDSDWINKSARADLKPDEYTNNGANGENRAEGIVTSNSAQQYKQKLWLRDVWLPSDGLVVTYGVKSQRILNVVEWEGPAMGPYHKLGFSDVPGNLLPLPPVSLWRDLHELANALFRKLGNQADGQKSVLGFQGGDPEGPEDFKKASDGDGIRFSGPEPKELKTSGVDAKTLAFFMQCRDLYSYFAGNLDSLGGLAPMTQTVGQDRLLSEAAGAQLRDMAVKTVDSIREVFRALAYYEWHDPIKRRMLQKPIPNTDMKVMVEWNREAKKGDFSLYDLNIDVYSMQDDSPGIKLQKLGAVMQQYILPLAPLIQQAGGTIDAQAIVRDVARLTAMPEIGEYVQFMQQQLDNAAGLEPARMPAQTTRTYERVGRPGMSRQGASDAMQQLLMGGDPGGDN